MLAVLLLIIACFFVKADKAVYFKDFSGKNSILRKLYYILFYLFFNFNSVSCYSFFSRSYISSISPFSRRQRERCYSQDVLYSELSFSFSFFAGNLSRIDAVNEVMSLLLKKDTLLVSILSCQIISNVPSAILLSQFTTDYSSLLLDCQYWWHRYAHSFTCKSDCCLNSVYYIRGILKIFLVIYCN